MQVVDHDTLCLLSQLLANLDFLPLSSNIRDASIPKRLLKQIET